MLCEVSWELRGEEGVAFNSGHRPGEKLVAGGEGPQAACPRSVEGIWGSKERGRVMKDAGLGAQEPRDQDFGTAMGV